MVCNPYLLSPSSILYLPAQTTSKTTLEYERNSLSKKRSSHLIQSILTTQNREYHDEPFLFMTVDSCGDGMFVYGH